MEVKGYQTLEDRENPDEIERNGPFKCRRKNAWLGEGYYFWDTNIDWAHDWGKNGYRNNYIICEAGIIINNRCFDLVGSIAHQQEFLKIIDVFKASGFLAKYKKVYIGEIIELMKNNRLLDYDLIRANDDKKSIQFSFVKNKEETTTLLKRTQICLVNKTNLILHSFKIKYPEKYLN